LVRSVRVERGELRKQNHSTGNGSARLRKAANLTGFLLWQGVGLPPPKDLRVCDWKLTKE